MKLPSPNGEDFRPYLTRAVNLQKNMRPPEWIPPEWPCLALLYAGLKPLTKLSRADCAALLRQIADDLDRNKSPD